MTYKMKCYRCNAELIYIKDEETEKLGLISMDCPNGCEGGYLVPKNNPHLIKIDD